MARQTDETFSQHESLKSLLRPHLGKVPKTPGSAGSLSRPELGAFMQTGATCSAKTGGV